MTFSSRSERRSILFLCDDNPSQANNVLQHIDAFTRHSRHRIHRFNPRGRDSTSIDLDEFDAVVIHYTLWVLVEQYLAPCFVERVRAFRGLKIMMVQDDYRNVDRMTDRMRYLGIDVLYTLVPEDKLDKVWKPERLPGVQVISTLAGFVPEDPPAVEVRPFDERPLDVCYRGQSLPYWLGTLGQEKIWIGKRFQEEAARYGLRTDIGWTQKDRIYGPSWESFIASARATLGTESGSSITDFDDGAESGVKAYLAEHPQASFTEVFDSVLRPHEGNVVINVISPRIFEAILLRTALILFRGSYSGIVAPDVHYIPLEKDFSNMDEVVLRLRDTPTLEAMVERAWRDVVACGKYTARRFVEDFDRLVQERAARRGRRARKRYWTEWTAIQERRSDVAPVLDVPRAPWRLVRRHPWTRPFVSFALYEGRGRGEEMRRQLGYLSILLDGVGRIPDYADRYEIGSRMGENGELVLYSERNLEHPPQRVDPEVALASLRGGACTALSWDHSAFGQFLHVALSPNEWVCVRMGRDGRVPLDLLLQAGRHCPDLLARILEPILRWRVPERPAPDLWEVLRAVSPRRIAVQSCLISRACWETGREQVLSWMRRQGLSELM